MRSSPDFDLGFPGPHKRFGERTPFLKGIDVYDKSDTSCDVNGSVDGGNSAIGCGFVR